MIYIEPQDRYISTLRYSLSLSPTNLSLSSSSPQGTRVLARGDIEACSSSFLHDQHEFQRVHGSHKNKEIPRFQSGLVTTPSFDPIGLFR